jgi:hypothetical protein
MPPLPLDWLATLPGEARAAITFRPTPAGDLEILRDGQPIGDIRTHGVPVTLAPVPFGPGFARLGIVGVPVTAGTTSVWRPSRDSCRAGHPTPCI